MAGFRSRAERGRPGPGRARVRAAAVVLAVVAAGVACTESAGPDDDLAACLEAAGVTGAAVAIRGFAFQPVTLTVSPGTTVTWVNCEPPGVDAHTTTSDDGVWDSGLLSRGGTFARVFDDPGTFPYFCLPHTFMRGTIVVAAGS